MLTSFLSYILYIAFRYLVLYFDLLDGYLALWCLTLLSTILQLYRCGGRCMQLYLQIYEFEYTMNRKYRQWRCQHFLQKGRTFFISLLDSLNHQTFGNIFICMVYILENNRIFINSGINLQDFKSYKYHNFYFLLSILFYHPYSIYCLW
jgi:hypothetical protein